MESISALIIVITAFFDVLLINFGVLYYMLKKLEYDRMAAERGAATIARVIALLSNYISGPSNKPTSVFDLVVDLYKGKKKENENSPKEGADGGEEDESGSEEEEDPAEEDSSEHSDSEIDGKDKDKEGEEEKKDDSKKEESYGGIPKCYLAIINGRKQRFAAKSKSKAGPRPSPRLDCGECRIFQKKAAAAEEESDDDGSDGAKAEASGGHHPDVGVGAECDMQ